MTVNNHQKWSPEIGNLLQEVLEEENRLSWGYDSRRKAYLFPVHNLRYEPKMKGVEAKREKAREPEVKFLPQDKKTTEFATFSERGKFAMEIEHAGFFEIDDAAKLMRLFLREKDEHIAAAWPKKRLRELIVTRLKTAGQDATFLSKENLLRLQQGFGPMFRELDKEHPRMRQIAEEIVSVDMTAISRQSFSESALQEHGTVWYVNEEPPPFQGQELHLWEQYQKWRQVAGIDESSMADNAREIARSILQVDLSVFKTPWNIHYASYEPERRFSDLLFEHANYLAAFVKMPNVGGYAFPYHISR